MSKTLAVGLVIGASLASSVGKSISGIGDTLSQLQQKSDNLKLGTSLGKSFQDLREETMRVRREYERTGFANKELGAKLLELQRATVSARTEAERYGFKIKDLAKQMGYLGTAAKQAEAQMARVQARQERAQVRTQLRGELMGTMGVGMALAASLKPAIDFEDAFAGVLKVTNMGQEEAESMKRDLLDITTRIPMSAVELTSIAQSAGQMGIKGKQAILNFTTAAAKMGVAFDISADEAGRAMAEIRNSSGLTQAQVLKLGDAINHLSDNTAGKAANIVEFMRRLGGTAKLAGIAPEKMAAMGTAFDAAGVAPERAARASNDLVMRLSRVSQESKSVQTAFERMGYDTKELQKRMLMDPEGTIMEFLERAGKSKNVLATLSGTIGTGFADEMAMLVANVDKYKEALALVDNKGNYNGSMEREFENRSKTTANALKLLKNSLLRIATIMGSVFLPHIAAGAKKVADFAGVVAKWATENPKAVKLIGSLIAGFVGMKAASLVGRIGISHLMDGFSLLNGGFQKLRPSSIQAFLGVMRMKGAGGVFKSLLSPLSVFKGGFMKDMAVIKDVAKAGARGFKSMGKFIAGGFVDFAKGLAPLGKASADGLKVMAKGLVGFGKGTADVLINMGKGALGALKFMGKGLFGFVKGIGLAMKTVGMAMMANPVMLAIGITVALVIGAAYLIWKHWDKVKAFFIKFWGGVKTKWEAFKTWCSTTWSALGEAIKKPFTAAFEWVGAKIESFKSAWQSLKNFLSSDSSSSTPSGTPVGRTLGSMPGHATGGVFNKPHIAAFAEGGKAEAVIPLEGDKNRARSIWAYSGQRLGMDTQQPVLNGGNSQTSQVQRQSVTLEKGAIVINAAPGMDTAAIANEVMRRIEQAAARKARRSFTDVAFAG